MTIPPDQFDRPPEPKEEPKLPTVAVTVTKTLSGLPVMVVTQVGGIETLEVNHSAAVFGLN